MKFYCHITNHVAPDGATYVQMVGYHTLEEAYHKLMERGETNIPTHEFNSFDFKPDADPDIDSLDSPEFNHGGDKYDLSAKIHNDSLATKPVPNLDPAPERQPSPEPQSNPDPEKK